MVEIIIDGRRADTYRDVGVTLNFNSSILGDVSSIKCSASQTIKLPKTTTNDAIFDLPHLPSYESGKAHKVLSCQMYVDGISVFDNGLCHLLAGDGDHYEVAVTFGVMHGFEQWLKNKPKLRELTDNPSDAIPWDRTAGVSYWGTSSIFYALYDYIKEGDKSMGNINLHPCVTLAEIWRRISDENGLSLTFDGSYIEDMARKAIVLTKNENTSLQTMQKQLVIQGDAFGIANGLSIEDKKIYINVLDDGFFNVQTSSFVYKGYKLVSVYIGEIYLSLPITSSTGDGAADFKASALASPYDYSLVIKPYNQSVVVIPPETTSYENTIVYKVNRTFIINGIEGEENQGKDILQVYARIKYWKTLPGDMWIFALNQTPPVKDSFGGWFVPLKDAFKFSPSTQNLWAAVNYTYQNNSNDYPLAEFSLVKNLPDITQLDFINFVCKFYGLFPMQDDDGVTLVPFSRLFDNIDEGNVYDWSKALTEKYLDCPNSVSQTIDGYAQRNTIGYKDDKNDNVTDKASVNIDDTTLDAERKFIEFPFAASLGNRIPQYSIKTDGTIEKNDCEYRLMAVTDKAGAPRNQATFSDDLKSLVIKNKRYSDLQDVIRKPMQIEEEMMLSLIDLKTIDYSKPVYLSKYGRYFAVISIQWSSDKRTSKVKLLRIK